MNHLVKAVVLSLGLVSMAGLTACQSSRATAPQNAQKTSQHEKHHKYDREFRGHYDREAKRMYRMTDEERAKKREAMQQRHAEHKAQFEALQKACEGKVGQNISVKIGEKTVEGACEVRFKPTKPERKVNATTQTS